MRANTTQGAARERRESPSRVATKGRVGLRELRLRRRGQTPNRDYAAGTSPYSLEKDSRLDIITHHEKGSTATLPLHLALLTLDKNHTRKHLKASRWYDEGVSVGLDSV